MDHGAPTQAQTMLSSALPPPLPDQRQFVDNAPGAEPPKRAGQLTPTWRMVFGFSWAAIIICYAAVWETSRVIGLSTWWLGADAEPQLLLVKLLPFYGPILVTAAAAANWRYLPYLGIAAAAVGGAIAAADVSRVQWLAVVEFVLAGAGLCVSVAALAGMYRPVR
ncbi:MAG TPA: hypothetical protein VFE86_02665 [Ilumatobacteraceae bacterium]|nr:hypothetical protein [Ilumatobacteraceae bacterium]